MTGYYIYYQYNMTLHSMTAEADATSATITGLIAGVTYSINVVANSTTLPSIVTTAPNITIGIRESVDSLCRDGADMPRPPYIGKACTRPNLEDLSLFRYLTIVYESLCTQ